MSKLLTHLNTSNIVILATQNQISTDLSGEAVILHLASGVYYGLNEVGARIWDLIQQPRTVSEIQSLLLAEYEVEAENCHRDLVDVLKNLESAGLIEVIDEENS